MWKVRERRKSEAEEGKNNKKQATFFYVHDLSLSAHTDNVFLSVSVPKQFHVYLYWVLELL